MAEVVDVVVNGDRYYAERKLIEALAVEYRFNPAAAVSVARLCDERLDPSGRLLGEVRIEVARLEMMAVVRR